MQHLLALDVGERRTGVAFAETETGVALAMDTINHKSVPELVTRILEILKARKIDALILGLPLLPSGKEGAQCVFVRSVAEKLASTGLKIHLVDERYTTPQGVREVDGNASAACQILLTFLDQSGRGTKF